MKRRDFLHYGGMGLGAAVFAGIPIIGHAVSEETFLANPFDAALKSNWQTWC